MLIVKDIQDAITMKNKLDSVVRRARTFGRNAAEMQVELDMVIEDLANNITRIESEMEDEMAHIDELFLQDSDGFAVLGGRV